MYCGIARTKFGSGPGEYSTVEEYEKAREAVEWARQQAAQLAVERKDSV